ncbi:MAG: fructose-bisphosphatase class II [Leifsonia sp.]
MAESDLPEALVDALLAATAAAARAALARVGSGDPDAVDGVAVDALRTALAPLPVAGRVVAGEGEKDDAPMLHPGEVFGTGGPAVDIVVDPVDGTRLAAAGRPGAIAVLAAAERGAFIDIGPAHYLDKLVCAYPDAGLALSDPVSANLERLAAARGRAVADLRVAVQSRERNRAMAMAVADAGAQVVGFEHGDIERTLAAASVDGEIDLLLGIGGAPEGVIEAAAVIAIGGAMQARFAPQSRAERSRLEAHGLDSDRVIDLVELCSSPRPLVVLTAVTPFAVPGRMLAAGDGWSAGA